MNKIISYLMNQKLLINLVVALILISGLYTLHNLNREAFSDVNFDMVTIKTLYPGASPDELEQLVSLPIEEKLREVDGLDKVRAYNIENVSVVVAFIDDKAPDKEQVVQDIKDAVDTVDNLPDNTEDPVVEEIKFDKKMLVDIAVYGRDESVTYREIRETADKLKDYLYELDGVAEVETEGYYDREYLVEVDPAKLRLYRLGINNVINTLRQRNLDLPGGSIKVGDKEFVLRTKGQYRNADEILDTVIISNDAGFVTRIRDIADVKDTFKEATVHERYNGNEAVILNVWKKKSADELNLVDKLRSRLAEFRSPYNSKVKIEIYNDWSKMTRTRISAVLTNAITGLILLAGILILLLGFRIATIVSIGIPLSFMIAFMGLKIDGLTLNVISLFGLIMVLGMIVDFSIVVVENSHRYMEMGKSRFEAILNGVREVFWPVAVTLICISAAFAPLLFLSGLMGKFVKAIPVVIMICLGASFFIAMFIMPTFLNIFLKREHANNNKNSNGIYELGIFGNIQHGYRNFLEKVIKHRYITLGILLILLIGSLGMSGVIGFVFIPGGGEEEIKIAVKLPQGTNLDANLDQIKKIEQILLKLPKDELNGIRASVGREESDGLDPKPGEGTNKSTIFIYLTPDKDRKRNAYTINEELRKNIETVQKQGLIRKDTDILFNVEIHGPPAGKAVNIEIRGDDFAVLKEIAAKYMQELNKVKGVRDITFDLEEGKQEYRYFIKEVMASRTRVSVQDVALALNASYQGAVATSTRIGDEDVDIRVRFPESERKRMKSLKEVMISNNQGGLIPLDAVTGVKKQPGYSQINRLNYKRIVQVQANVDTNIITSVEVNRFLQNKFADIGKKYPDYDIAYAGEQEDTSDTMGEMGNLFLFALLIIYIVLSVFFGSLILPVVIMSAIPFALVGVVFALFVHGQPLSFMSMLGVFSLAGVIVSNTLVLVQFINNQRDEGCSLKEALLNAGVIRLRPVILTSGTTVLALFPTIYGLGGMDYMVAPLALSFGYGLIFATFITLLLIPAFYHIAEDFKGGVSRLLSFAGINMDSRLYRGKQEIMMIDKNNKTGKVKSAKKE